MIEVDVKINEVKETISEAIRTNALDDLATVLEELRELEGRKKLLQEERDALLGPVASDQEGDHDDQYDGQEVPQEEAATQRQDPPWMAADQASTLLKAVAIAAAMLKECRNLWTLQPSLRSLFDSVLLVSLRHLACEVREKAVLAVGLCCLLDRDLARQYLPVLLTSLEVDIGPVRRVAAACIVDLILRYILKKYLKFVKLKSFF